jgi:hypothetical protein
MLLSWLSRPEEFQVGLFRHNDRESQYLLIAHGDRLAEAGINVSVGSIGNANAMPSQKR